MRGTIIVSQVPPKRLFIKHLFTGSLAKRISQWKIHEVVHVSNQLYF
jgi:hypothetical protein